MPRDVERVRALRLRVARLPEPEPDPRQELGEPERLRHVVVRAALERRDRVGDRVAGGEDDHRHPRALVPESLEHAEPVETREPDVEDREVEAPAQREVEALDPVADGGRAVAVGAQPLRDERGDPLLVLDDQDPGHVSSSSPSVASAGRGVTGGSVSTNRAPGRLGVLDGDGTAVRVRDGRARWTDRGRTPRRRRARRCGRSARRSGPCPRPVRRHRCPAPRRRTRRRRTTSRSRPRPRCRVCLTALSASASTAWVIRCSSIATIASPASSRRQSRSASPRALASNVWVSRSRLTGCGARKSGRPDFASRIRSPTSRDIRSISSSSSGPGLGHLGRVLVVEQLEVSAEHGQRRLQLVADVVQELPLARRTPASSRASMPLKVRVSAVMSSFPVSGSRRARSVSLISSAVSRSVRSGASRRPDCHRPGR